MKPSLRLERIPTRTTHRGSQRSRLLGMLALCLAYLGLGHAGANAQTSAAPDGANRSAGVPPGGSELVQAKAAEEGDGDLPRALATYRQIIARYDAARKEAAEALFRVGELTLHSPGNEARAAYRRVVTEFSQEGDYAARARQRLREFPKAGGTPEEGSTGGSPEGAAQVTGAASPAPEATTGDGPEGGTAGPGNYPMSEELMRRYGLISAAKPALKDEVLTPQDSAPDAETRDTELQISQLRAELAQLNGQFREVGRELRVSAEIQEGSILEQLPIQMVKDPTFLQEIEEFRRSIKSAIDLLESLLDSEKDRNSQAINDARSKLDRLRGLFGQKFKAYRARLQLQSKLLGQEIAELKKSIDQMRAELRAGTSKRR